MKLAEEILDHAPDGLSSGHRLLLTVIAAACNDQTREGWPGMEVLTRRTRLTPRRIRQVLEEVAEQGLEVRVQLGIGKDGRPYYSKTGQRSTYRIPAVIHREEGGSVLPPEGGSALPPEGGSGLPPQGAVGFRSGGSGLPLRGQHTAPLSSENRQRTVRSPHETDELAAVVAALVETTGREVSTDHAVLVVRQVLDSRTGVRNRAAYLSRVIRNDPDPRRFLPTPTPPAFRAGDRP